MMLEALDFDDMKLDEDKRIKLKSLIEKLQVSVYDLENINYTVKRDEFFAQMDRFKHFLYTFDDSEIITLFLHTKEFILLKKKCYLLEEFYVRALETKESIVIASQALQYNDRYITDFTKNNFIVNNYEMVKEEFDLISNKNIKKLVMVGCGPLPETILFLADNTTIPEIIGVDADVEAITMAGEIVKALGHSSRVRLLYAYGEDYNYEEADVIHIANSVHGKQKVLERIALTGKKGVEVIVRNPISLTSLLKENIQSVPSEFIKKDTPSFPISKLGNTCVLLEKFNY